LERYAPWRHKLIQVMHQAGAGNAKPIQAVIGVFAINNVHIYGARQMNDNIKYQASLVESLREQLASELAKLDYLYQKQYEDKHGLISGETVLIYKERRYIYHGFDCHFAAGYLIRKSGELSDSLTCLYNWKKENEQGK